MTESGLDNQQTYDLSDMSDEMLKKYASNGASLLDIQNPKWYDKIDVNTLNMRTNCVLHMVYGDYEDGIRHLFASFTDDRKFLNGFTLFALEFGDPKWDTLTQYWKNEIFLRR
jgi:hypothetical protein